MTMTTRRRRGELFVNPLLKTQTVENQKMIKNEICSNPAENTLHMPVLP
jgi:hypothetical protein